MSAERHEIPLEEPQAALERAFIDEYLRTHDQDLLSVYALPAEERKNILREAALYAAIRLAEHEARAHYIHDIHGATTHH
jgi:hypothetical protein